MYRKILKKDLKRKKTMNIILLLFIIISATFMASSMNNAVSIITTLDGFLEKAGIADYTILALQDEKNHDAIQEFLTENEQVENYALDYALFTDENYIHLEENGEFDAVRSLMINSLEVDQSFFDINDRKITDIENGEIYVNHFDMVENNIKEGDSLFLEDENGYIKEFVVKGTFKDALLGSAMIGLNRFLVNEKDFSELHEKTSLPKVELYSIHTKDISQFEQGFVSESSIATMLSCTKSLIRFSYVMDMVIAAILLVVSICLILISMVILRFTIVFTLQEEYREIGIMKAIGIAGPDIRKLYIVKYLLLSLAGAAMGFGISIPFGKVMLKQVSDNIVMSNGTYGVFIGLFGVLAVVAIIMLFSYLCTRSIMGFSPVDAIRNGTNGERFHKKGLFRLSKFPKMSPAFFMAVNDIASSPKRFGSLFLIFMLGTILILIGINSVNTLNSDNMIVLMGMVKSDAYLASNSESLKLFEAGERQYIEDYLEKMEEKLSEYGISGKAITEATFPCKLSQGENDVKVTGMQAIGALAEDFTYMEGYAPRFENEVALTHITARKVGAKIGDSILVSIGESEKEFMVTALFQSMNNMGNAIRFSEKTELDYGKASPPGIIQILFTDETSPKNAEEKVEKLNEAFPEFAVYQNKEYIVHVMGDILGKMADVKLIIVVVVLGINMLVAVLMVKTFITRERGEIGVLKSIGYGNEAVVKWQVSRIGIIMLLAVAAGIVLSNPLGQLSSGAVFRMMGLKEVPFIIAPLEVYVLYPVLLLITALAGSLITAQEVRKIDPREMMNIE